MALYHHLLGLSLLFFAPTMCLSLSVSCDSDVDCSLNGECVNSACSCDPGWRGAACDMLDVQPTPSISGYRNSTEASWGGNVIYAEGGYHLFVAQFVNGCPLGEWGSASSIIRAESDSALGPFTFKETVIPAFSHNPTIRKSPHDGLYYLYMIGAGDSPDPPDCTGRRLQETSSDIHVSKAESIRGPWSTPTPVVFNSTSEYLQGGYTNPSPHFMPDGSVYLAFQAGFSGKGKHAHGHALVGIAHAPTPSSAFTYVTPDPVTPMDWDPLHPICWAGVDEDPFLWIDNRGFHILTHGMCPSGMRQAHYKFSEDGVKWHTSPRQTYHYTVQYTDARPHVFARMERPQLYFEGGYDENTGLAGTAKVLINGVCGLGIGHNHSDYECAFDKLTGMTWTLARPLGSD